MPRLGDELDVPFESGDYGALVDEPLISGGLVVLAATVPVEDETKPAVVFRFAKPDGSFYQPIVIVMDDDQAAALPPLITAAVEESRRVARG